MRPGTDAWCLAALGAVLVQEDLLDRAWLAEHAAGLDEVEPRSAAVDVADVRARSAASTRTWCARAARRIAAAGERRRVRGPRRADEPALHARQLPREAVWLLTGNFAKPGAQYVPSSLVDIAGAAVERPAARRAVSPVAGARIISGLVPCNVIAEEILTDHPPATGRCSSRAATRPTRWPTASRMREALASLDLRRRHRRGDDRDGPPGRLRAAGAVAVREVGGDVLQLRLPAQRVPPPPPAARAACRARCPSRRSTPAWCEALGASTDDDLRRCGRRPSEGRAAFADAFFAATAAKPELGALAPIVLYRTLGPTLPDGAAAAAVLWGAAHRCAHGEPRRRCAAAGFDGEGLEPGEQLFDAILASPSGVVFTVDEPRTSLARGCAPTTAASTSPSPSCSTSWPRWPPSRPPGADPEFPFVLSAGERRSFTANTIFRDPAWREARRRRRAADQPVDAAAPRRRRRRTVARLTTRRGGGGVTVEVDESMQPGHVSLPNGLGLDYPVGGRAARVSPAWRPTS